MQIAQVQAYSYECTPCSDVISGPKNRVFDIKSGHNFCRYRNNPGYLFLDQCMVHISSGAGYCLVANYHHKKFQHCIKLLDFAHGNIFTVTRINNTVTESTA